MSSRGVQTLQEQEKMSSNVADDEKPLQLETTLELPKITSTYIKECNDYNTLEKIYSSLFKDFTDGLYRKRDLQFSEFVQSFRNPEELTPLTEKWLTAAQESLRKLYEKTPDENKGSFQDFLDACNIDYNFINYDPETDTFSS